MTSLIPESFPLTSDTSLADCWFGELDWVGLTWFDELELEDLDELELEDLDELELEDLDELEYFEVLYFDEELCGVLWLDTLDEPELEETSSGYKWAWPGWATTPFKHPYTRNITNKQKRKILLFFLIVSPQKKE